MQFSGHTGLKCPQRTFWYFLSSAFRWSSPKRNTYINMYVCMYIYINISSCFFLFSLFQSRKVLWTSDSLPDLIPFLGIALMSSPDLCHFSFSSSVFKISLNYRTSTKLNLDLNSTHLLKRNSDENHWIWDRWKKSLISWRRCAIFFFFFKKSNVSIISLGLFNSINKRECFSKNTISLRSVSHRKDCSQPPT